MTRTATETQRSTNMLTKPPTLTGACPQRCRESQWPNKCVSTSSLLQTYAVMWASVYHKWRHGNKQTTTNDLNRQWRRVWVGRGRGHRRSQHRLVFLGGHRRRVVEGVVVARGPALALHGPADASARLHGPRETVQVGHDRQPEGAWYVCRQTFVHTHMGTFTCCMYTGIHCTDIQSCAYGCGQAMAQGAVTTSNKPIDCPTSQPIKNNNSSKTNSGKKSNGTSR